MQLKSHLPPLQFLSKEKGSDIHRVEQIILANVNEKNEWQNIKSQEIEFMTKTIKQGQEDNHIW